MPPEFLLDSKVSPLTDVWELGITFYGLTHRKPAFKTNGDY